jgi:hypothetical protein
MSEVPALVVLRDGIKSFDNRNPRRMNTMLMLIRKVIDKPIPRKEDSDFSSLINYLNFFWWPSDFREQLTKLSPYEFIDYLDKFIDLSKLKKEPEWD